MKGLIVRSSRIDPLRRNAGARLRVTQKNSIRDKQNGTRNEGRCDSKQYRRLHHAAPTR